METYIPLLLFLLTMLILLLGFPVAFSLAGSALIGAGIGILTGHFDQAFLMALPERIYGTMTNETLLAVPLFVFMGVMLEKSKLAEDLLQTMAKLFGRMKGGLGLSVFLVGGLLAASTGIVGATVVTMGLISLPSMLRGGYSPSMASGIVSSSGTLGQIIPPSIVLIILGDVISSANQQAQLALGNWSARTVSVGDLFAGALIPGLLLLGTYILYTLVLHFLNPQSFPKMDPSQVGDLKDPQFRMKIITSLFPPLILIVGVLGSILVGAATPTEAASVGVIGAMALTYLKKSFSKEMLKKVMLQTTEISTMIFTILIGAGLFSLIFRGLEGDAMVENFLLKLGGGQESFWAVMALIFFLGFFLDFFEITFVVIPIVGPILIKAGLDPIWLGIMVALNLQTSFLTPPFGFSLFYLRGVAPKEVTTTQIYRGAIPFVGLQLLIIFIVFLFPKTATYLPHLIFGN